LIRKCLQDPKPTGVDGEFNYLVRRASKGDVLEAARGAPRIQRKHYIATDGTDVTDPAAAIAQLAGFWSWVPGERTSIQSAPLELLDGRRLGELGVPCWRVDHPIAAAAALPLEPPVGGVIASR